MGTATRISAPGIFIVSAMAGSCVQAQTVQPKPTERHKITQRLEATVLARG